MINLLTLLLSSSLSFGQSTSNTYYAKACKITIQDMPYSEGSDLSPISTFILQALVAKGFEPVAKNEYYDVRLFRRIIRGESYGAYMSFSSGFSRKFATATISESQTEEFITDMPNCSTGNDNVRVFSDDEIKFRNLRVVALKYSEDERRSDAEIKQLKDLRAERFCQDQGFSSAIDASLERVSGISEGALLSKKGFRKMNTEIYQGRILSPWSCAPDSTPRCGTTVTSYFTRVVCQK